MLTKIELYNLILLIMGGEKRVKKMFNFVLICILGHNPNIVQQIIKKFIYLKFIFYYKIYN